MAAIDGYKAGINFGDWMEMWPQDEEKLNTWLLEKDVKQVADYGFDHIRLPFSYKVFMSDDKPGWFREEGLKHLDRMVEWCKKYGLNIVLDLHIAPGYSFGNVDRGIPNPFLDDETYQEQFYDIWRMLARRYFKEGKNLAFELLNEVVEEPASRWNRIANRAIAAIRQIDPTRIIIYGGIYYNSVYYMKYLDVTDDPNIIYNFHFYEPILFTHQLAWPPACAAYNKALEYPGEFPGIGAFLDEHPEFADKQARYIGRKLDKDTMRMDFEKVIEFKQLYPNAHLYCGEFGVIKNASAASKRNWLRDIISIFNELDIGRAAWDYKDGLSEHFAFVDIPNSKPFDEEALRICAQR